MEKKIPIFYNLFQNQKEHGNSFHEASTVLITKADEDIVGKENYRLVTLRNMDAKILNKMLGNRIQQGRFKTKGDLFQTCKPGCPYKTRLI